MAYYFSPFRKKYTKNIDTCPFCDPKIIATQCIRNQQNKIIENDSYYWMVNRFPKFEGHTILVSKRHISELGKERRKEIIDREKLMVLAADVLHAVFPGSGIELFLQTGEGSQSSVSHLHWHVVPASPQDPFRSFEKLGHFYTTEPGQERLLVFPTKIRYSPKVLLKKLSTHLSDSQDRQGEGDRHESRTDGRRDGNQTHATDKKRK